MAEEGEEEKSISEEDSNGESELTEDQLRELIEAKRRSEAYGFPVPEPKHNIHTFLNEVRLAKDTTKIGNLSEAELGLAQHSVRTYQELALFADKVMDNPFVSKFFKDQAEIVLATSLSKHAKLLNAATTQKRIIEDETKPPRKQNPGWFKSKDKKKEDDQEDPN